MAVTLTAHGNVHPNSVSSNTISVTVATSGSTLVVGCGGFDGTTQSVTSVTYNSVALTQLDASINPAGNPGLYSYTFVLQNVAAGTANLVVTYGAVSAATNVTYAVFSGATTSGGVDGHNKTVGISFTSGAGGGASITTIANNCIVYGYCAVYSSLLVSVAGTNQTLLDQPGNGEADGYTTNPVTPAASTTLSYTTGTNVGADILLVSIAPSGAAASYNLMMMGVGA